MILIIAVLLIRIYIHKQFHRIEGFQTPWNTPFLSGAAFQQLCDYSIDNRYTLIPYDENIQQGDRVFMKVNDIPSFLKSPPSVPVSIVISNSDETFDDKLMESLKPYTTAVYAINCSAKGAKQIPIGFRDDAYTPHKDLTDILGNTEISGEKEILCLVNFLLATNPTERQRAYDIFSSKSWVKTVNEYSKMDMGKSLDFNSSDTIKKRLECYKLLKQTKFVVCPPGVGVDTHRVYETLFFGGIPIIKSSFLDPMYEKLGGCWIVKDWAEVAEDECNRQWTAIKRGAKMTDAAAWLR